MKRGLGEWGAFKHINIAVWVGDYGWVPDVSGSRIECGMLRKVVRGF
jgi:hypothetical protein